MDYSAIIDPIRVERLELVEILAENRLDLVETLNHLTTTSPSMIQLILLIMEQYRQLKNDMSSMLDNLDSGRKTHSTRDLLIARESNKTALLRPTK